MPSPSSAGNERFNAEAAAWDSNPDVHRASDGALQALLAAYPDLCKETTDVLEIGCGTGLLSLRLAPYVRSILAVDAAQGMIDALEAKLAREENAWARDKITPLSVLLVDPEDERLPPLAGGEDGGRTRKKFDLITSHLVLHHIADLRGVLTTMFGCLRSGTGEVALTDFEDFDSGKEARKFHPEGKMFGVERHGIARKEIEGLMREVGFVDVSVEVGFTMEKEVERFPGEWGGSELEKRPAKGEAAVGEFPFLLCRGRRP